MLCICCHVMEMKALNFYIMNWFFVLILNLFYAQFCFCDCSACDGAIVPMYVIMYSDMFYILCPA
jgi:hypothetical protein